MAAWFGGSCLQENFPEADRALVLDVIASPGFYEVLEPLPGAVEADGLGCSAVCRGESSGHQPLIVGLRVV